MMRFLAVISVWLVSAGALAAACPPLAKNMRFDKRAVQGADCAFDRAAENDVQGFFRGKAAVDLKHGQVGQRVEKVTSQCGGGTQALIVLDCKSGQALALSGRANPVFGKPAPLLIGPAPAVTIANIQPPNGPIALGKGTPLAQLKAIAKKHKIGIYPSLDRLREGNRARNRVDFWCGCKRFYPNSTGARS